MARADFGDADRESAIREDRRRRRYERTAANMERTRTRVELETLQKEVPWFALMCVMILPSYMFGFGL
jgi:hypothetical protein